MPIFDFFCNECGFKFEDFLKSSNEENSRCTKCNGETKRLISRFFGVVKGSEHRSLDCLVGDDSEKRWQSLEKKRNNRKEKQLKKNIKKIEKKGKPCGGFLLKN